MSDSMTFFNVYDSAGNLRAKCVNAIDAAVLVAVGEGGVVRFGKALVWSEGKEDFPAAESYDGAAEVMLQRWEKLLGRWWG